jgi:hypothetical protein
MTQTPQSISDIDTLVESLHDTSGWQYHVSLSIEELQCEAEQIYEVICDKNIPVSSAVALLRKYSSKSGYIERAEGLTCAVKETVEVADPKYIGQLIELINAFSNYSDYPEHVEDLADAVTRIAKAANLEYTPEIVTFMGTYVSKSDHRASAHSLCDAVIENLAVIEGAKNSDKSTPIQETATEPETVANKTNRISCGYCRSSIAYDNEACPRCGGPLGQADAPTPEKKVDAVDPIAQGLGQMFCNPIFIETLGRVGESLVNKVTERVGL